MFGPENTPENQKYISLTDAAIYSEAYSQEYLSLRARQGKLKAVKLGRNWVTTKQWVDEYVHSENNIKLNGNQAIIKKQNLPTEILKEIPVPAPVFDSRGVDIKNAQKLFQKLAYCFSAILIVVSFVVGFVDYKIGVKKIIAKANLIELEKKAGKNAVYIRGLSPDVKYAFYGMDKI